MEKDKLLRNVPQEILDRVRRLSARLWAENNPVAVQLSVILEEFDGDAAAVSGVIGDYENYYAAKVAGLKQEIQAFRERAAALEDRAKASEEKALQLKTALEKSESDGRAKYSKDEVMLIERQIQELKKEVGEFRQLKEMDDRKIMELEALAKSKGDEVERRFLGKVARMDKECQELRAANAGLEKSKAEDDASIKNLRAALEKSERESREKYTRAEVDLIERQILDLKKELGEFRQLKEMDDRKIMELEALVNVKGEEVERRFIAKTTLLEKECAELRAANAGLEKSALEDDASIKNLRAELEKSERESREKYTRAEVELLEKQVLDLKKEVREGAQLKDAYERRIAGLEERVKEKTDDVERKFIGRITMLEGKVTELSAVAADLEKINSESERRIAEMKHAISGKDSQISAMYTEEDVRKLEGSIGAMRQELAAAKTQRIEDERRIAELERIAGEKTELVEKRYVGRIAALETRIAELGREVTAADAASAEQLAKVGDLKKALIGKEKEIMDLKSRISDAEMQFGAKLAEAKDAYFQEQRRLAEKVARLESEAASKLEERRAELEADYQQRGAQLRERVAALEADHEAKRRELEGRKAALEEDFAAGKRELIRTFDKIREEMERREAALAAREAGAK